MAKISARKTGVLRSFLFSTTHEILLSSSQFILRLLITWTPLRALTSWLYLNMSAVDRQRFHANFAKTFREVPTRLRSRDGSAEWKVRFCDRLISMPLQSETLWLDWDTATSIVGHDIEVKETYAALLSSDKPPELFVDVGANYGTHAVLFHLMDIPVIAFEPNSSCMAYSKRLCDFNGLQHFRWEPLAIGEGIGQVSLSYPRQATWFGSICHDADVRFAGEADIVCETVPQSQLDSFIEIATGKRVLLKIDVEGLELDVLRGASRFLREVHPLIIFESNDGIGRREIFAYLDLFDYDIGDLFWPPGDESPQPLKLDDFLQSKARNFLASCRR